MNIKTLYKYGITPLILVSFLSAVVFPILNFAQSEAASLATWCQGANTCLSYNGSNYIYTPNWVYHGGLNNLQYFANPQLSASEIFVLQSDLDNPGRCPNVLYLAKDTATTVTYDKTAGGISDAGCNVTSSTSNIQLSSVQPGGSPAPNGSPAYTASWSSPTQLALVTGTTSSDYTLFDETTLSGANNDTMQLAIGQQNGPGTSSACSSAATILVPGYQDPTNVSATLYNYSPSGSSTCPGPQNITLTDTWFGAAGTACTPQSGGIGVWTEFSNCEVVGSACTPTGGGPAGTILSSGLCSTDPGSVSTDTTGSTCPITDAGALTWIFCPIYTVGVSAVKALSAVLESFLYVPNVFLTSFQGATNSFRDFGEALLVIAGSVMVVSQAAGLEIFAAYTVRKALPRIIIAAIGIALSGPVLAFIVTFFNDLGTWTQALILNAVVPKSLGNNVSGVFTSVLGAGGAILVSVAAIAASALVVLSMIGTLLLALFVGFLVLTIRQLVIVVCLITAPLAIASYVLPGTDRIWQFWRKAFLSTMIMFPIIMSTLGAGLALSYLAGQLAKSSGTAWALMSILALVAPLFLLPFSFALAGGIMASVHGLVNGAHQGAFTRLSKFRQEKVAERVQDAKAGKFWQQDKFGSGALGKAANRLAGAGNKRVLRASVFASEPFSKTKRSAIRSSQGFVQAQEVAEKNEAFNSFAGNDSVIWAASGGHDFKGDTSEAGIRKALIDEGFSAGDAQTFAGQVMIARNQMGESAFRIALSTAQGSTGTGFKDNEEMLKSIAWAAQGDGALAGRMLLAPSGLRARAVQSGRLDLGGAGANAYLEQLKVVMAGGKADVDSLNLAAFNDQDAVSLARQRENGLKNITGSVVERVHELETIIANQNQGPMTVERSQELDKQKLEFGRLTAGLEKLGLSAREYAAPGRTTVAQAGLDQAAGALGAARRATPETSSNIVSGTIDRKGVQGGYEEQRTRYADPTFDPHGPNDPHIPPPPPE